MKKIVVPLSVIVVSFLLYGLALAGPKDEVPNYRNLPLKAESSCIDSCGEPPDSEDLEASYEYQMCVSSCLPIVIELQRQIDAQGGAEGVIDSATCMN